MTNRTKFKLPMWRVVAETVAFLLGLQILFLFVSLGVHTFVNDLEIEREPLQTLVIFGAYLVAGIFAASMIQLRKDQWGWVGYLSRRRNRNK